MNILYSAILKSAGLSSTLDLLSTNDFVTLCNSHLENTGDLSYVSLPNGDTFHYAIP